MVRDDMPRLATPEEVEEFQRTSWFCRPENQPIIEEWIEGFERGDPDKKRQIGWRNDVQPLAGNPPDRQSPQE